MGDFTLGEGDFKLEMRSVEGDLASQNFTFALSLAMASRRKSDADFCDGAPLYIVGGGDCCWLSVGASVMEVGRLVAREDC